MENNMRPTVCTDGCGMMPECAPMAVPYVPFQQTGAKKFGHCDALNHGTLFPGLDLPFRSKADPADVVQNALNELQALEFVILELGLYLDTHQNDAEAFALFQEYVEMEKKAREAYEAAYGPLKLCSTAKDKTFTWMKDPWPWNYQEGGRK